MNCPNCQTENPQGARFCFNCGKPLTTACTNCGTELQAGARFCHNCGHPVAAGAPAEPAPAPSPARTSTTDQLLQRYLPRELLAKLESARSSHLMEGERRVVTILFCDVQGSTAAAAHLDPEEWAEIINGAFEHMIKPVYHYEGTVARLQGDGVLAFFGAPIAHEDDPERAVLAGLEILQAIRPYGERIKGQWGIDFNVRVGINTGLVVVGEVGSDLRVEYTALGDAINIAAWMEQNAKPGTVLIAEPTYKHVAPLFEVEEVAGVQMKGRQEAVTAYRPTAPRAERGSLRGLTGLSAPLIGRQEHLRALWSAAGQLKLGRGQIISLTGEAGLGKSRLISEFSRSLRADDELSVRWLEGRTLSYQTSKPFAPFIDLFTRFFSPSAAESKLLDYTLINQRLQPIFNGRADEIAPFFASLLGLPLEGMAAERINYIPPPRLRGMLFAYITALLESLLVSGPLVLYLDDLHWSDPTSIELLQSLLPLTDRLPLMVIVAFRPRPSEPSWEFHTQAERTYSIRYLHLDLSPLSEDQSRMLVSSLLEIDDLPEKVRLKIMEKAEGNPFFVEEVIRSLLDNKLVVRVDEHWQARQEIDKIDLPDTLVGVITARLDRLTDRNRLILQAAGVLGREFSSDVLLEITRTDEQQLEDCLSELQRRDLLREKSRYPQRTFSFKHVLTQEAAYNSILLSNRRELHRLAADAIIARTPDAAAEIARHLLEARLPGRAIPYLVQAGAQANRNYAIEEAVGFFRKALELKNAAAEPSVVQKAFEGLGHALAFSNRFPEALETYREMLALAEERDVVPMQVSALNKIASVTALNMGQFQEAEVLVEKADHLSRAHDDKSGIPETNLLRCMICSAKADFESVVMYMGEVVEIGNELGSQEFVAMGLEHVATSLTYLTRFDEAYERAQEALQVSRQIGDRQHECWVLSLSLPMCALHLGDISLAEDYLKEGLQISIRIGFLETQAITSYLLAQIAQWRGEYEQALEYGQTAMQVALPLEQYMPFILAGVLGSLGMIYMEISRAFREKVVELHQHALRVLELPMGAMFGGLPWADLGLCAVELGDYELAEEAIEKGLNSPNTFFRIERPRHLAGAALLACSRGDFESALRLADEARQYAEERGLRQHYPLTALVQGKVRAAAGKLEPALMALEVAVEEANGMNMRPTARKAHEAAADALMAAGRMQAAGEARLAAQALADEIAGLFTDAELRQTYLG